MILEDILKSPEFRLPGVNISSKPFIFYVEQKIQQYIHHISTSYTDLFKDASLKILAFREYCDLVTHLGHSLLRIIRVYNASKQAEAYIEFKKLMSDVGVYLSNRDGAVYLMSPTDTFYRCKYPDTAGLRPQEHFFHTPFDLSHKSKSTRFSFNGFPSMYLTNAMIVGYLETRATAMDNFQGVKIKSRIPLSFLDIDYTLPPSHLKLSDKPKFDLQLQMKGLVYPLLLCCYCEQNDPAAAAPQEYIIPQFLVRWVIDNNIIFSGIKYQSTRIHNPNYKGEFFNLIVPPLEIKDIGYCAKLKKQFLMSEPCSATLSQKEIADYYKSEFAKIGYINNQVSTIEWNSGMELYEKTEIGQMEFYIKNELQIDIIKF